MDNTNLNLGRYSIRKPDEASNNIEVGSYWKQQQQYHKSDSNISSFNRNELKRNISDVSPENDPTEPRAKRFSTNPDAPRGRANTQTMQRNPTQTLLETHSLDSSNLSQNSSVINVESGGGGGSRLNLLESRLSIKNITPPHKNSEHASYASDSNLVIDTQASRQSDTSIIKSEVSHESLIVNVDLTAFGIQNDDSGELSQERPSTAMDQTENVINTQHGENADDFIYYEPNPPRIKRKKIYPKILPYNKILSGVTFVMSGYENPRRSKLRDLALSMGAKYQPSWNRFCTHLICAFKTTPKYKQVMAENGRIVREHWIQMCSDRKQLLDWREWKLGKDPYPDSEEEVEVDDLDYALNASSKLNDSTISADDAVPLNV